MVGFFDYAVQAFDHIYFNGREVAVMFDHPNKVIRVSKSATVDHVAELVADETARRVRLELARTHRRNRLKRQIPVIGDVE